MLMNRPGSFISDGIKFLWHSFFNRFVKFNYAKLVKGPHRRVWRKKTGRGLHQHYSDFYSYLLDAGPLLKRQCHQWQWLNDNTEFICIRSSCAYADVGSYGLFIILAADHQLKPGH